MEKKAKFWISPVIVMLFIGLPGVVPKCLKPGETCASTCLSDTAMCMGGTCRLKEDQLCNQVTKDHCRANMECRRSEQMQCKCLEVVATEGNDTESTPNTCVTYNGCIPDGCGGYLGEGCGAAGGGAGGGAGGAAVPEDSATSLSATGILMATACVLALLL